MDTATLAEIRQRTGRTQATVARALDLGQSRVSYIEIRPLEVSQIATVRRYLAALGATLRLVAVLDGREIEVVEREGR